MMHDRQSFTIRFDKNNTALYCSICNNSLPPVKVYSLYRSGICLRFHEMDIYFLDLI
jgi:hypothetical protein